MCDRPCSLAFACVLAFSYLCYFQSAGLHVAMVTGPVALSLAKAATVTTIAADLVALAVVRAVQRR